MIFDWIYIDPPDDEELRRDVEEAYAAADVGELAVGSHEAAHKVAEVLQRKRPQALIVSRGPGYSWIVSDPGSGTSPSEKD